MIYDLWSDLRFILLLKSNLGVELQSSERLKKCSRSPSAATLAAMLNTFYVTVYERSVICEVMGTGRWDSDRRVHDDFFWGTIQTNFGCSEAHRQSPLLFGRGQPLSFTLSFGETPWFDEEGEIRR